MNEQTLSNLRLLRQSFEYKQSYIADLLGISQPAYSKIENGKTELSDDIKSAFSKIYNKPWQDIENYHEINNPKNNGVYFSLQKKMEKLEAKLFLMENKIKKYLQTGGG